MTSNPLVLIVDDSQSLTDFCEFLLTNAGYRVATATNGRVGLALARNLRPDLILLDMMLPEVDGLGFIEQLRHDGDGAGPRVIAMTGFDEFEVYAKAPEIRAYLRKPVESDDLLAVVSAVENELPIDDAVLARQRRRSREYREATAKARHRLLAAVELDDEDLRRRLHAVAEWCVSFFGVTTSLVTLEDNGRVHVEAAAGPDIERFQAGDLDARTTLCDHVTKAGGPMLMVDAAANPALARLPAVLMGYRFYAGAPLITPDRVILGTLCLIDRHPQIVHGEDITVLEALAEGLAKRIAGTASPRGDAAPGAFVVPGVFTSELMRVVLRATLKRLVEDGGEAHFCVVDLNSHDAAALQRCAEAVYAAASPYRMVVAEYARGIAIATGPTRDGLAARQIDAALDAVRRCGLTPRGAAVVTVQQTARPLEVGVVQSVADECCVRSVRAGGAVERVKIPGRARTTSSSGEPTLPPSSG